TYTAYAPYLSLVAPGQKMPPSPNQPNTRFALPLLRSAVPEIVVPRAAAPLGYWVPSSPMPRAAFQQSDHRETSAAYQAVLTQCVDRVLAAGRAEATRG